MNVFCLIASLAIVSMTATAGTAVAQESRPATTAELPGGASSLNENHGDWTVSCDTQGGRKNCFLSQALGRPGSSERVLSVELVAAREDRVEGMLLGPFGLNLAKGVALSVDETSLGVPLVFLTCIENGCLAPLAFETNDIAALKSGKQLKIAATSASNGAPVELKVSLNGFTAALARVRALSR